MLGFQWCFSWCPEYPECIQSAKGMEPVATGMGAALTKMVLIHKTHAPTNRVAPSLSNVDNWFRLKPKLRQMFLYCSGTGGLSIDLHLALQVVKPSLHVAMVASHPCQPMRRIGILRRRDNIYPRIRCLTFW